MPEKIPITILIGGGSKLPAIIKASKSPGSKFTINLVVTHKTISPGIELALKNKIPAVFFKLPNYRQKLKFGNKADSRMNYMRNLGWFISQYKPKLLVFAGWDLVMNKGFFEFFKSDIGNGYAAINLHPAILPIKKGNKSITLPDGTRSPILKGVIEEVLEQVIKNKLTYFGPTVHFMQPNDFDTGLIIKREFIKISPQDNIRSLVKKLAPVEDKILIESINDIVEKL